MRKTLIGLTAVLCLAGAQPGYAICWSSNENDRLKCQLDQARQARDELEQISKDRRFHDEMNPGERPSLSHFFLDSREKRALKDLEDSLGYR
jgi:hypothetical protein